MVNIQKSGDSAIKFTFTENDRYLYDGEITVPLNSLILVFDESDMVVIKKVDGDVFLTFLIDNTNFSSKADLESWFKENACDYNGVTPEEVQDMIDESISGKADTSDVQEIASDVATVSGDVNTLSGSVNALTGAVNTLSGDVSTLSGAVDSNHNAITAVVGDVQTLSGQVQGDETILTGHTANTDIHVTASDKQNWNNKSDFSGSYNDLTDKPTIPVVPTNVSAFNNDAGYATSGYVDSSVSGKVNTTDFNTYSASTNARLAEDEEVTSAALNELNDALDDKADTTAVTESINAAVSGKADTSAVTASITAAVSGKQDTLVAGTNITISGNVISAEGGSIAVDQAFDRDSTNAIANSAVTRNTVGSYSVNLTDGKSFLQAYDQKGYGIDKLSLGFSKINGRNILQKASKIRMLTNFDLVETSAITSSVTSASTDSEIPSAKAVYDALQEGGGGLPESAFTAYTASTDARLAEDEEVTAAGLNALNDVLDDKADASAFTAHTADTTIHTTSAEKTSWNGAVTALGGLKLVSLTQAQYDNLATKDASTLYIVVNNT